MTPMNWNIALFHLINAGPRPTNATVTVAVFAANALVPLAALVGVVLWTRSDHHRRGALLAVGAAILFAMTLNWVLGLVWFEPRPFMIGVGHTLMAHVPDNSFPSDHVTFLWAIGFAMISTGAYRRWGLAITAAGAIVAWARIYLGVHFPIDILGSGFVALSGAVLAALLQESLSNRPLDFIERAYDGLLDTLHLPAGLFPRRTQ